MSLLLFSTSELLFGLGVSNRGTSGMSIEVLNKRDVGLLIPSPRVLTAGMSMVVGSSGCAEHSAANRTGDGSRDCTGEWIGGRTGGGVGVRVGNSSTLLSKFRTPAAVSTRLIPSSDRARCTSSL